MMIARLWRPLAPDVLVPACSSLPTFSMAEQKVQQLQAQIDALQAQLAQMQLEAPVTVGLPVSPALVGHPVSVREITWNGGHAPDFSDFRKPDRGEWTCYSIGWIFCYFFFPFPVGCLIWSTIACDYYCQPREERRSHPLDGQVAKAALITVLTWSGIVCLLFLTAIMYQASHA